MKTPPEQLVSLAETLAAHQGVTHWAISVRYVKKGDFFARLLNGSDVRTATYTRLMQRFADDWPADLDWPEGVPMPRGDAA
jgi:hypothetical protein